LQPILAMGAGFKPQVASCFSRTFWVLKPLSEAVSF
jgi:hypothetical protein